MREREREREREGERERIRQKWSRILCALAWNLILLSEEDRGDLT
jgi:hypothetical protein